MESRGYINDSIHDPYYISNQIILEGFNPNPILGLITFPEALFQQSFLLAMNNLDVIVNFATNFVNVDIIYLGLM